MGKKRNKILAVIPARGNSKGIPKKNIKLLCGKPLLAYTIEAALKASTVDRTIVSTEDPEIAEIAIKFGAEIPFLRPKNLARDSTPTWPVVKNIIDYVERKERWYPDIIATLWLTTPFRTAKHIDEAMAMLGSSKVDTVVGIVKIEDKHPFWMKRMKKGKVVPFIKGSRHYLQRQELPTLYMMNGAFTIRRRYVFDWLVKGAKEYCREFTKGYIMDPVSSIDINAFTDFYLAEAVLKRGLVK